MRSRRPFEIIGLISLLIVGGLLFVWMVVLKDAIPVEYREASPGFGWSWDFDYESAMHESGRSEVKAWPWPAQAMGNRLVLPRNQPLHFNGLKLTYRGMPEGGGFRLDVVILGLDPQYTYQHTVGFEDARQGFTLADRHFLLERITSRYLRLHLAPL